MIKNPEVLGFFARFICSECWAYARLTPSPLSSILSWVPIPYRVYLWLQNPGFKKSSSNLLGWVGPGIWGLLYQCRSHDSSMPYLECLFSIRFLLRHDYLMGASSHLSSFSMNSSVTLFSICIGNMSFHHGHLYYCQVTILSGLPWISSSSSVKLMIRLTLVTFFSMYHASLDGPWFRCQLGVRNLISGNCSNRTPLSKGERPMYRTLGLKKEEAHVYEARALPHCQSLYLKTIKKRVPLYECS